MFLLGAEEIVAEGWWITALGAAATAIGAAIAYAIRKLVNVLIKKMDANDHEKEAFQALLEGMAKTQEEYVRQIKTMSKDGKLTKGEIETAKKMAWSHAKKVVTGPAKDIVVAWSFERVSSLIKQFLSKMTGAKKSGGSNGSNS